VLWYGRPGERELARLRGYDDDDYSEDDDELSDS